MTSKRKRYSADFKAKVALEALRGELTINSGLQFARTGTAQCTNSAAGSIATGPIEDIVPPIVEP